MDEIWARIGLIAAVLAIAGGIVAAQRLRERRPVRAVRSEDLPAGVYFFSSASCPTCNQARDKLDARLGREGYVELMWEDDPGPFADLDIDVVPAVVILAETGDGRLYPGQPDRALSRLDP